jgi:hypothetical protein
MTREDNKKVVAKAGFEAAASATSELYQEIQKALRPTVGLWLMYGGGTRCSGPFEVWSLPHLYSVLHQLLAREDVIPMV